MKNKLPVVTDTRQSPYARLRPVPITAVSLGDGFWRRYTELNISTMLEWQIRQLEKEGLLDSFRRAADVNHVPSRKRFAGDARLYKWLEAASWAMVDGISSDLEKTVEDCIDLIEAAQSSNGYINTNFPEACAHERWTRVDTLHELFAAGHLIQAGIAHRRVRGKSRLFEIAVRFADHIYEVFGPGKKEEYPGHPEVSTALVELYRETGDRRYLDTAVFFTDQTGGKTMTEILGHAVKALFFNCDMADCYAETGDIAYKDSLESLWHSMVRTKMYVTGGVGGRPAGESVGREWELPHETGYAETCANIANVMWNWRMLVLSGEARFADLMELALYNSVISGVSLSGTEYFYDNPHRTSGTGALPPDPWDYVESPRCRQIRQAWFDTACCPPNLARLIASLRGYFYTTSNEGIWMHLYDSGEVNWQLPDGTPVHLHTVTNYPWDGQIEIEVDVAETAEFSLFLRIPGWCQEAHLRVGGTDIVEKVEAGKYFEVRRVWDSGITRVELELSMLPEFITANPMLMEARGAVAIKRGPIVYCLESVDNPGFSVRNAQIITDECLQTEYHSELLGGVVLIKGNGLAPVREWGGLYRVRSQAWEEQSRSVSLIAVPYYTWANRGISEMTIWIRTDSN